MYNHSSTLFSIVDIKQAMHNTSTQLSSIGGALHRSRGLSIYV